MALQNGQVRPLLGVTKNVTEWMALGRGCLRGTPVVRGATERW
jgi:hypothetical protein